MNMFPVAAVTVHPVKVVKEVRRNVSRKVEKTKVVLVNVARRNKDRVRIQKARVVVRRNVARNEDVLKRTEDSRNNNNHGLSRRPLSPRVNRIVIKVASRLRPEVNLEEVVPGIMSRQQRKSVVLPVVRKGHLEAVQDPLRAHVVAVDQSRPVQGHDQNRGQDQNPARNHVRNHARNHVRNPVQNPAPVAILRVNPEVVVALDRLIQDPDHVPGQRVALVTPDHLIHDQDLIRDLDQKVVLVVRDLTVEVKVDKAHQFPENRCLQVQIKLFLPLDQFSFYIS